MSSLPPDLEEGTEEAASLWGAAGGQPVWWEALSGTERQVREGPCLWFILIHLLPQPFHRRLYQSSPALASAALGRAGTHLQGRTRQSH